MENLSSDDSSYIMGIMGTGGGLEFSHLMDHCLLLSPKINKQEQCKIPSASLKHIPSIIFQMLPLEVI
jgi:hypothetical protein